MLSTKQASFLLGWGGGGVDNWNIPVTITFWNSIVGTLPQHPYTFYVGETTTLVEYIKKYSKQVYKGYTSDTGLTLYAIDINVADNVWYILSYCEDTNDCQATSNNTGITDTYTSAYGGIATGPWTKLLFTSGYLNNTQTAWDVNAPMVDFDGYIVGYSCVLENTLITLADGTKKKVQDLTYEDTLRVWDFDKGEFSEAPILWLSKAMYSSHYYRLTFSDGTTLEVVGADGKAHRVFNEENQEFTYGSYFHPGQHTFKDDASRPHLVSVELVEKECTYYNLITNYHMNFFANSVLTSCGYNNMYPIKDMKFVKDDRKLIAKETYGETIIEDKYYEGLRLAEQDLEKRSVLKAQKYIARLCLNDKARDNKVA